MTEALSFYGGHPPLRRSSKVASKRQIVRTPEKGAVKICEYRPDGVAEGPTVLIAPGWGEGTRVLDIAAKTLATKGRIVVTMDHLRTSAARTNPEDYKSSTLEAVYDHILDQGNDAQIVAHSEGAISTVKMLVRRERMGHQEIPDNVVLAAPAGFIGPDDWINLIGRAVTREMPHALSHSMRSLGGQAIQAAAESAMRRYHVVRNLDLGVREAKEIAMTDLVPDTIELARRGVRFTMISCRQDGIFPYDLMYRHTEPLRAAGVVNWQEADIKHHEFLANPRVLNQINANLD